MLLLLKNVFIYSAKTSLFKRENIVTSVINIYFEIT